MPLRISGRDRRVSTIFLWKLVLLTGCNLQNKRKRSRLRWAVLSLISFPSLSRLLNIAQARGWGWTKPTKIRRFLWCHISIYAAQISALIISFLHTFASVSNMSSSNEILEVLSLVVRVKMSCIVWCDQGGPVVIIIATGPEVCGFKPGRGRWIISDRKNPEYDFVRKVSKAVGPVS